MPFRRCPAIAPLVRCLPLAVLLLIAVQAAAQTAPQLVSAVSRKSHGGTNYDVTLPLSGNSGIECRAIGGGR